MGEQTESSGQPPATVTVTTTVQAPAAAPTETPSVPVGTDDATGIGGTLTGCGYEDTLELRLANNFGSGAVEAVLMNMVLS
ncbi:hypothetical protein GCM10029976_032920 [Kribbella albertanoniae]|uniref:Uncharacterized protein n=1 Tax=Kribbella albertanoniae TaxID=1266829 RepID=A0A4R4QIA3_9ACTN|nr:hypothetical protein [Kribbella albertanoniae]TDC35491.1 hypothetical protein E1261_01100 [Kribbella albertanoniae]